MTMSRILSSAAALAALSLMAAGACAQGAAPADESKLQFFAGERLWHARWDHRLLDAMVTAPPTATSPAEVTLMLRQRPSSKLVPIHSVGLRYKDVVMSASGWSATFDMGADTATGNSKRNELDLSLGYVVYPGITASIVYKRGEVESALTSRATSLLGMIGKQKGTGVLAGFSASAPLSSNLSLNGSLAYGSGRYQVAREVEDNPRSSVRYTIGDLGIAYRFDTPAAALDSLTLQFGYRFQTINFRTTNFAPPSSAGVRFAVANEARPQVTTEGMVLSASVAF